MRSMEAKKTGPGWSFAGWITGQEGMMASPGQTYGGSTGGGLRPRRNYELRIENAGMTREDEGLVAGGGRAEAGG